MGTMMERVSNAVAQGTRWRASPNAHQGKNHRLQQFQEQSDELGQKFPPGSPRNDFRDSGQAAVPPKWLPFGGWVESEYQSGPDRIVKSSRRWITFSALEWITFRALQTALAPLSRVQGLGSLARAKNARVLVLVE